MSLAVSALEPARASPRLSRIDFFPSSTTSEGTSEYFALTAKSETYFVTSVILGSIAAHGLSGAAEATIILWEPKAPAPAATCTADLRKLRLIIASPLLL